MTVFRYVEQSGYAEDFDVDDTDAAVAYARHMLRDGDWDQGGLAKTMFVHATVTELDDERQPCMWYRKVTVEVDPAEPPCPGRAGHDWDDGTGTLNAGGVITRRTCAACRLARVTDTWGRDPADGSVHETLAYEPAAAGGED